MELKAYIAPLRKWWWLLIASTLVAAISCFIAVSQQPPIYQAKATLLIGNAINNPNPTGNDFFLSQQLAQTYTAIAQREVVQNAVMDRLGLTWLPEYTARGVPNTQLLEILVTDTSPERAMVIANELANQVVLLTPTSGNQQDDQERAIFINQQLDDLEAKIEETKNEILVKQDELAELFSARQIADTQGQIAALETKLDTLQSNYASLLASTSQGAVNTLSIIEPAIQPQVPIGPEVIMTVITAAAIGLSLAVGAAYLLEYLDDTVKTPDDVQSVAQLPTLTGIASFKTSADEKYHLITQKQPRSPISEAYRALRTAILFTNVDKKARTILITSPNPGEGKSLTAANLAVVMAQAGHKVLLIDADLRRPVQHKIFDLHRNYGLTDLLVEMSPQLDATTAGKTYLGIQQAVMETSQQGLFILSSGSVPPNPAELAGSGKMKALLDTLAQRFDFLIIDSPPSLAVTDAVILSTRVDSVLLIANAGMTRRNQLKQAVDKLREVNANLAGITLNRLTARSGDYYYYYYYRKSYYHNDSDGDSDQGQGTAPQKKKKQRSPGLARFPLPEFLARRLG